VNEFQLEAIDEVNKPYVASSREYIRNSYITWCAEIGCRVGDVATPGSWCAGVCKPGSASI